MCVQITVSAEAAAAKIIFISVHNIKVAFKASENSGIFPIVCVCVCVLVCVYVFRVEQ